MSTLKALLKDVPVDWKTLGEVSYIKTGQTINKDIIEQNPGIYPVINSGKEPLGFINKWNTDNDPIGITSRGAGVGSVIWQEGKYFRGNLNYSVTIKENINNRFLFYILLTFKNKIEELCTYDGIPALNSSKLKTLFIPIPYPNDREKSLEIQQEIVRVLDGLSEQNKALTSALAQEINQRKKQYAYYREELFRFEGKHVEWKTLGDENVGKFTRGSGLQKKDFTEFGIGCIHYGQVYTYYNTYTYETKSFVSVDFAKNARKAKTGDLVIATTSENDDDVCKAVAWLGEEDIAVSSDACFYSHKLNPKYVSYYFQTEQFQKEKRKYITGTKVRRVNVNDLEKITIPNPDITEQERIVNLLDQFDEATKNIVAQLEKEIELRNKKYEYYRNLLLSFSN